MKENKNIGTKARISEEICRDLQSLLELQQAQCERSLAIAFVQGAQWWEYRTTAWTMWQSDATLAEAEAARRIQGQTLGKTVEEIANENAKDKSETK